MKTFEEILEERKKKKGTTPTVNDNSTQKSFDEILAERGIVRNKNNSSSVNVASTQKATEEPKWYDNFLQLGDALSDGWQFGDITKTLLGTNTDMATNLLSGIVGWGEEAIKAGATVAGTVTEKLGMDDTTEKIREFVATDLYDANAVSKQILSSNIIGNVPGLGGIGNAIKTIFTLEDFLNTKEEVDNGFGGKTIVREDNSIFADDADALLQSVGETGAKMGISALSGGLPISDIITGITVYGSQAEQAIKEDATFSQATGSALISAAAEILFEKLSGGIKFGGVTLDDGLTRLVSKNISNVALKNGIHLFKDFTGEALEEVLTEFVSKLGTSLYKEEDLTNILFSEDALQDYIKAGFSGGLMGGLFNAPKALKGTASGVDYKTGLTKTEQAVFDKEYNDRIAEATKDGKKASAKDKSNIYNSVMDDIEKGRISIDTIESVLGGDTYKQYQSAVEKDNQMKELQKEYDSLYQMKSGDKSDAQADHQAELKQQLEDYKNNSQLTQLKDKLSKEVSEMAKVSKLNESYNEKSRRSQAFEADLTQYDEKHQGTYKRAIESGILNNTNRTHEFVDLLAKLEADKGVLFDFTNNAKIKETGFAIEGKQVNGYVQGNNISINIDSTSALNKVVGHEIAHVLEGTELYTELANAVKELATTKGEYDSKLQSITKLYEGIEDANIENELTADLIGEYLFTDSEFINRLSAEKPTLFQKIFDEIKYLCKVATAGSKEAKQLEKVKKTFEEAYSQKNNTATDDGVKYSLNENFNNQFDSWDKKTTGFSFVVGKTSDALIKAGIPNQQIRWDASKIKTTIEKHNGMSPVVIKQVPELLENPVVVIDSKSDTQSKIVMGELYDDNGKIVTAVLKLKPTSKKGNQLDLIKISSAQGRGHIESLFKYEDGKSVAVRYVDEKRIQSWLNVNRLQLPLHSFNLDSNNSVPQDTTTVNNNSMQKNQKNSLSNTNEDIAPVRSDNVYGENIKLQTASAEDIAPIGENVIKTPTTEKSIIYGDEPIKATHSAEDVKQKNPPKIDLFVKPKKAETEQTATPEDIAPVEQSAEITETVEEKPKSKRFERAIRKIDTQLEQDKADLLEDFQQKKAELEKALENKTTYISDKSLSLYKELQNLRKGKRASNDLAYFLDLKLDWNELKSTLLKVHKRPDTVINDESEIESIVREAIGRDFDEKSYELDDLDTEYQKQIEELDKKAEEKRKKAGIAEQRRVKQQEYKSQMDELIGDTTTWKDKKLGVQYRVNTLRRNLRDIVRDKNGKRDLAKADAIYDELQGQYNHNEAELNREANKIKKVYADMNITKAEDTYIQMLGEYRHNPDTKLTLEEMQEFLEKNKDKIDQAKVDKIINLARGTYDSLFGRVNAVLKEQGMREIPYRLGYFPHFTEEKQGRLAKLLNWKTQKNDIPTDIAGLTEQFNPNRSWQSFNKQRSGDDTDYSFMKGLDTYVQGSLDWIYHIEDIQKRRAFENHIRYVHSEKGIQEKIDAIYNNEEYDADEMQEQVDAVFKEAGNPLNNFVTDFRTQTNTLAGKKSSMDRNVEAMLNRDVYSTMTNISNRVTANMVVGSISSALTNFIPITQSWGEVSPISSLRAMKDTIKSTIQDDGTIDKSDFLTNRLRKSENLYQTTWDKVIDKAGIMMEAIDSFTSQTVWRSKYLENISKGMGENEAIKNADQFAENVLAGRSRGNNPTIFDSKNPLIKTMTAFQLEVNNQYGYMFKDMPQDMKNQSVAKLAKGYATMFIGAYVYNAAYSALTGRDAAFDPISIIQELFGDLFDDEEDEPADVIMDFTDNVLEEVPFVGGLIGGGRIPISSALPYDDGIYGAFEGAVTDVTEGNWKHLAKEMGESFISYLLLPAGGGQIKKSAQGLSMFIDDDFPIAGSYTDSGKLRFKVEETPGNIIQAALFGQYASKTARQYFDEEHTPLSSKKTEELSALEISMEEYWEYQKGLKKLGEDATLAEKVNFIANLDGFETWQKNIMANNLTDRKTPIDLTGYEAIGDFEEFDFYMKNPEKYAVAKAVGGYDSYMEYSKRLSNITSEKDSKGKTVSGSRKKKVARYINNLDIEFGEKMILYKNEFKGDDTYNAQIVEYLNDRNDITYQEKTTILTELGFKVLSDGTVRW